MSTIVIVCVSEVELPASSVAVKERVMVYSPAQAPLIVVSRRSIVTTPQLSVVEASSIG